MRCNVLTKSFMEVNYNKFSVFIMTDISQVVTRKELFEEWFKLRDLNRDDCCNALDDYLASKRRIKGGSKKDDLLKFMKNVSLRWKRSKNNKSKFLKSNMLWLQTIISFSKRESNEPQPGPSRVGRPVKSFSECGSRAKQKKVKELTLTCSTEELTFTVQTNLRKSGKRSVANIIGEVSKGETSSQQRILEVKKILSTSESEKLQCLTPDEALALIINTRSSKSTYLAYRMAAKNCNSNIYPSWHQIVEAKRKCYPDPGKVTVEKAGAKIVLQELLNLTAHRLCILQQNVLKSFSGQHLTLVCKWGIDGNSGQSNYRQMTSSGNEDSSVLITSLVPVQLRDSRDASKILWQNPVPSSTRLCRAIQFVFAKESAELTKNITAEIEAQIQELNDFIYDGKIFIKFHLVLTMVDGKVCHTLTETKSTQSCYICVATPRDMNNLDQLDKRLPKSENYCFGLSSLHSWIRFFECCLHVGYRLDFKSWQARGENRIQMETRKSLIKDKFKLELGILVDQPKPGYGSTNTGNTARAFFRNVEKSAEITGIDQEIIHRFHVILQTISCGYEVDPELFKTYAMNTDKKFISLYPWFYMPTSVHKVLVHGSEIIKHAVLPIGQLGEEAQEAQNKDFKFIREHRSRKDSGKHTNEDLFNYFLLSSDPVISHISFKDKIQKRKLKLDTEALHMLKEPPGPSNYESALSDSDSD